MVAAAASPAVPMSEVPALVSPRFGAEAAATNGTVYLGDKGLGHAHYGEFCASYVPDIINVGGDSDDDGMPSVLEIKNYSCFVTAATNCPAVASLNGGVYAGGNTRERLKHRVLGSRQRGVPSMGAYDHSNGSGHVERHDGDYRDAINKAAVHLLVHEATIGGMAPYSAKRLRPPRTPGG